MPGGGGAAGGQRRGLGSGQALGPGGECVCPVCKTTSPHVQGYPCNQRTCPKCGAKMTR
jgi:hypothetical protein